MHVKVGLRHANKTQIRATIKEPSVVMATKIFPRNQGYNTLCMVKLGSWLVSTPNKFICLAVERYTHVLSEEIGNLVIRHFSYSIVGQALLPELVELLSGSL